MNKLIYFLLVLFLLSACSSSTLDDLQPIAEEQMQEEDDDIPVDVVVTYEDVEFIFTNTCIQCHSNPPTNGAPFPFSNYAEVRSGILNNGIIDRISRNEGEGGLMPLGGPRLPQANIDLIIEWETDGLLEN